MITIGKVKERIKKNKNLDSIFRVIYKFIPVIKREQITFNTRLPYSKLENDNKIIFIHIPKVAGNGIIRSLFSQKATGHDFLLKYKKYDLNKYNTFYKFGFTRNPWDRLASAYFYLKEGGMGLYDIEFAEEYLKEFNTFEDFVMHLRDEKFKREILKWTHFIPQYKFLVDENDNIGVDYLGKLETIENDFDKLKVKLCKPEAILEKHNKSSHKPYWEYYNEEMVEIVKKIYIKDIDMFNYTFPYEKIKE
ncbi:sulfotransferase family 2 domain-containing protein [Rossellomorea arthrocnemi]